MEYIRATVKVKNGLVRLYCHHGATVDLTELKRFFATEEVQIISVSAVDVFDLDDPFEIVMIDESGIYFW